MNSIKNIKMTSSHFKCPTFFNSSLFKCSLFIFHIPLNHEIYNNFVQTFLGKLSVVDFKTDNQVFISTYPCIEVDSIQVCDPNNLD